MYEKPTCTTCRKLAALLSERGIAFDRVNHYVDPLSESQLRELLRQAGLSARELRPIVQRGGRAVLARPPERVLELLD